MSVQPIRFSASPQAKKKQAPQQSHMLKGEIETTQENAFFSQDQMPKKPPSQVYKTLKSVVHKILPSTGLSPTEERLSRLLDQLEKSVQSGHVEPITQNPTIKGFHVYPTELKINAVPMFFEVGSVDRSYYSGFWIAYINKFVPKYILTRNNPSISLSVVPYDREVEYHDWDQQIHVKTKNRYLLRKAKRVMKRLNQYVKQISSICAYRAEMEALKREKAQPEFRLLDPGDKKELR